MTDKKTIDALEAGEKEQDNTIKLSTGVVLLGKKINPLLLMKVMAAHPRPKPPIWHDPKMGREMENNQDPDYLDRVQAWQMQTSMLTLNAMILHGTELVSKPKKLSGHMNQDWLDEYALLNLEMLPDNKAWRYVTWVMFRAAVDEEDLKKIQDVVGRLSGVSQDAVEAAETFPGRDQEDRT